jgi:hypothetical protein
MMVHDIFITSMEVAGWTLIRWRVLTADYCTHLSFQRLFIPHTTAGEYMIKIPAVNPRKLECGRCVIITK